MKYSSQVTSKREEPPNPPITEVDNYTHVRSQRSDDNVISDDDKNDKY
jgi:hypothetical protein